MKVNEVRKHDFSIQHQKKGKRGNWAMSCLVRMRHLKTPERKKKKCSGLSLPDDTTKREKKKHNKKRKEEMRERKGGAVRQTDRPVVRPFFLLIVSCNSVGWFVVCWFHAEVESCARSPLLRSERSVPPRGSELCG